MARKNHLQQIGAHTWIFPLDSAKDRPNLGYIRGEKWRSPSTRDIPPPM
jgi:hypothetical protein